MAFCLGTLNEERQDMKLAIKYYKWLYFCARIIEDPVGAALALNRLGVAFHKIQNFEKSLLFHLKHLEQTEKDQKFASFYNIGISYRLLGNYEKSQEFFLKALEQGWLLKEMDSEAFSYG
mgnify:FL=1